MMKRKRNRPMTQEEEDFYSSFRPVGPETRCVSIDRERLLELLGISEDLHLVAVSDSRESGKVYLHLRVKP